MTTNEVHKMIKQCTNDLNKQEDLSNFINSFNYIFQEEQRWN